jgi:hypothetical protein
MSPSPVERSQRWFLVEVWLDVRERCKAIVGDGLLFITVLAILEVVDLILGVMRYPEDLKQVLKATHFWGSFSVVLVLIVNLIVKILLSSWRSR